MDTWVDIIRWILRKLLDEEYLEQTAAQVDDILLYNWLVFKMGITDVKNKKPKYCEFSIFSINKLIPVYQYDMCGCTTPWGERR